MVYVDILPSGVMWDQSLTFFYCLSDLGLEGFGWVGGGCVEVVTEQKVLNLSLIQLCGKYNYRITSVCTCYHGIVLLQFSLD